MIVGQTLVTQIKRKNGILFIHRIRTQLQTNAWSLRVLAKEYVADVSRALQLINSGGRKSNTVTVNSPVRPIAAFIDKRIHKFFYKLIHCALRFKEAAEIQQRKFIGSSAVKRIATRQTLYVSLINTRT